MTETLKKTKLLPFYTRNNKKADADADADADAYAEANDKSSIRQKSFSSFSTNKTLSSHPSQNIVATASTIHNKMSYEDKEMKKVLVFGGKTGWIGGLMCEMIEKEGRKRNPSFLVTLFVCVDQRGEKKTSITHRCLSISPF